MRRPKLALLTNIVAPYRLPIYTKLAEHFELLVLTSGEEDNRRVWSGLEATATFRIKRAWGLTIKRVKKSESGVADVSYIHINPGYMWEMIKFRPDVIVTNELGFRTLFAMIYGFLFRKPVWVWWGGTLHTERTVSKVKSLWRKIMAKIVAYWISYGETSTEYLVHIGVQRNKIYQIQNCVDEELWSKSGPKRFEDLPRPILLYVGQLIKRKGVDLLLKASARLQKRGLRFSLLIVGDGPEKSALMALAQALDLDQVHFIPSLSYQEMPTVYRSADCFVFPTLEDVWGLAVNEAILSGVPVICSIYAGCAREIVPRSNLFDPLVEADFDLALEKCIRGLVAPSDVSNLKSCWKIGEELAKTILDKMR